MLVVGLRGLLLLVGRAIGVSPPHAMSSRPLGKVFKHVSDWRAAIGHLPLGSRSLLCQPSEGPTCCMLSGASDTGVRMHVVMASDGDGIMNVGT